MEGAGHLGVERRPNRGGGRAWAAPDRRRTAVRDHGRRATRRALTDGRRGRALARATPRGSMALARGTAIRLGCSGELGGSRYRYEGEIPTRETGEHAFAVRVVPTSRATSPIGSPRAWSPGNKLDRRRSRRRRARPRRRGRRALRRGATDLGSRTARVRGLTRRRRRRASATPRPGSVARDPRAAEQAGTMAAHPVLERLALGSSLARDAAEVMRSSAASSITASAREKPRRVASSTASMPSRRTELRCRDRAPR